MVSAPSQLTGPHSSRFSSLPTDDEGTYYIPYQSSVLFCHSYQDTPVYDSEV